MVADTPMLEFTSHIAGKNAKVRVFKDRIEWERKGMSTKAKGILAASTAGMSYLATGFTGKQDVEMIPIKNVSSITSKKGVVNTQVSIITTGNTLDMNISHKEAALLKDLVQNLMLTGDAPAPSLPLAQAAPVAAPVAAAPAQVDVASELQKYAALRDQGIITDDDFDAKKRQLLGL